MLMTLLRAITQALEQVYKDTINFQISITDNSL